MSSSEPALEASCAARKAVPSTYEPTGPYTTLSDFNVYTVGPQTATHAIIIIYDIFGLANQTLLGADILAKDTNALVLVPDFFKGEPLSVDLVPQDTEEKKEKAAAWRKAKADLETSRLAALNIQKAAADHFPNIASWGVFGLCWGGKLAAVLSGPSTPFKAAGTAHPSRLDAKEAAAISVPYICLFSSGDGTPEEKKDFENALKGRKQNHVEHFGNMHHGWMGARAKLDDEEGNREFVRGYGLVADFFRKHL